MFLKSTDRVLPFIMLIAFAVQMPCFAEEAKKEALDDRFPGLISGALTYATLSPLPEDVLLKCGALQLTVADLDAELDKAPAAAKEQLHKNKLFLLDNIAAGKLLVAAAQADADGGSDASDDEMIKNHLNGVVDSIAVTDEEVTVFYEENKDMCGGATLDQIEAQIKDFVLNQKKQDAVQEYVRTLGRRLPVEVSAEWVDEQAVFALDNDVDRARRSGKPSLVDFGSTGCRPCDMMAPILETLESKYADTLNVVFIHVGEEQILASRYGIQSIPVQIFYDKDGKELYRHTGFYPQDEIEARLKDMGVQ